MRKAGNLTMFPPILVGPEGVPEGRHAMRSAAMPRGGFGCVYLTRWHAQMWHEVPIAEATSSKGGGVRCSPPLPPSPGVGR